MRGNFNHIREAHRARRKWERAANRSFDLFQLPIEKQSRRYKKWFRAEKRWAMKLNRCVLLWIGKRKAIR